MVAAARTPELGEQAVNEVLRYSPTATIWRHTAADLHHKGLLIPAGTPVHLSAHAAHRDPQACPDGDIFDITRGRPTTLLAFGGGAHYCPGAALARTELAEALTALASRLGPPTHHRTGHLAATGRGQRPRDPSAVLPPPWG
ncbi:cytochrome P450 [Streptomyces sp. NPDC006656]|uniref:cytochrome P450 n=1 Tax=Streptomyces sp. NPDC006656 TaxID=3156899 RepID=UPI003453DE03